MQCNFKEEVNALKRLDDDAVSSLKCNKRVSGIYSSKVAIRKKIIAACKKIREKEKGL